MNVKYLLFAALAAATVALSSAYADTPGAAAGMTNSPDAVTALFGDPVIAKGTDLAIKQSDLDEVVNGFKSAAAQRGEEIPAEQMPRLKARMLQRLIDIQLLLQKANDADKAAGLKKAQADLAGLHAQASQETLDMELKAAGTTEAQLLSRMTQELTAQITLPRLLNIVVTPDEVQKFYTDHPADFEQPEMVHVRHILLMTIDPTTREPLSDDIVKSKRKEADDVLMKARSGEDFAKLAGEYSEDPTTKDKGGELPAFPRGQMLPEFEAAAFALTNNEISDVVTTMYGYHIIKFIDRTSAKKLMLTDVVPGTDETISDRIKEVLSQQKTDELETSYLAGLEKAASVQILDPDLNAAVEALANTNAVPAASAPSAIPGGQ